MTKTPTDREVRQPQNAGGIRVLHVVVSLDAGGTERTLTRVARALSPRGFDIWVCGLQRRGILADTFPTPEHVVSLDKPDGRSLATIWHLYRLIRQIRPAVVHTHNLGPLIHAAAATGFGQFYPILHGEHGQLLGDHLGPPRLRLRRFLYAACRRVHTVSNDARRELLGLDFPEHRIVAVVNGVDTNAFLPDDRGNARLRLGLPTTGTFLAISARLVRSKRHGFLIEAISRLAANGMDVHLLIAGDGPLRAELQSLAHATGAGKRIHFLGYMDDVMAVYQAADLSVLPSTGEGLSNAILEAMACGTPVLCHDACGCTEVISDGVDGWVRSIESPEALAEILGGILSDRARLATVGKAARRKVSEHFNFAATVDAYERIYRDMAAGR